MDIEEAAAKLNVDDEQLERIRPIVDQYLQLDDKGQIIATKYLLMRLIAGSD